MRAATARHRAVRELFADFAKQSADLGAYGNGSRMKFVANHLVAIHNVASAEAMMLAERAGWIESGDRDGRSAPVVRGCFRCAHR